ncbi:MAG: HDIG domain-containing metalloprotein [archaeon]
MSKYPSRSSALRILREAGCQESVIEHCITVSENAIRMARKASLRKSVDAELVEIGAILHDVGRSITRGIEHGVLGAQIASRLGLDQKLVSIIANHVGAGIPAQEARELGLPFQDYLPRTLEEKIVCYADKITARSRRMPYEEAKRQMIQQLGPTHPAMKRLDKLRQEMLDLGTVDDEPGSIGEDASQKTQRIPPDTE